MNRLPDRPFVYLITDGKTDPRNFETERTSIVDRLRAAVDDGVNVVQIREKNLEGRMLFEITRAVVDALSGTGALTLVNDRADIAHAAGGGGVHLPATSLSASVVRQHFRELVVGVSTHSLARASAAKADGADYILFGPVFETPEKGEPVGISTLRQVCRELESFPVVALGGVDERNFQMTLDAGAAGLAAIRSLNEAESRRVICERLGT